MQDNWFWVTAACATVVSALGCEAWAAFVHRYVWHGPLWALHKSHHAGPRDVAPSPKPRGFVERNDIFAVLHAALAMGLVVWGMRSGHAVCGGALVGAGTGLSLFGLAYGLVHDVVIHQRLFTCALKRGYWRRVCGAHLAHHRTGQAPFGLFLAPWARRRQAASSPPSPRTPQPAQTKLRQS